KSASGIYLSALLDARAGKLDRADELLGKITNAFPNMPNGFFLQATVKFALHQYAQAEEAIAKYLARDPKHPAARRLFAEIKLRTHDPQAAIDELKPQADANPADRATINLLAQAYVAAGQKDSAVALYERAAEADPNVRTEASEALMRIRFGDAAAGTAELEKIAGTNEGADLATPLLVMGALRKGDDAKAAATAEAMVARRPDDAIALNLLGSVRIAQGRLSEARDVFQKLADKDPSFLSARRNLAEVYIVMHDPDDAKKIYLALLNDKPDDEDSELKLAQLALAANNSDEAVQWLMKADAAAPRDVVPGMQLLQIYASRKDWNDALKLGRRLELQAPFDTRVVNAVAEVRVESGDKAGAVADFRALVEHYPDAAPLYERYADYELAAGDKAGARASLAKAHELVPADLRYMRDLVRFDADDKGIDAALATARSFAAAAPAEAAILEAEQLVRAKRIPEAITRLSTVNARTPNSVLTVELAALTFAAGKQDDAKAMLRTWLATHDDDVAAHGKLGDLLMLEHDYDGAAAQYEAVRKAAPDQIVALNNLAWIYGMRHDPRAPGLAQRAYRLAPSPQTEDTLGWALVESGNAAGGLPYLKDASSARPDDGAIQYHYAAALNATGDEAGARAVLERVLVGTAVFDGRDDAKALLDRLRRG
ncbi:MAG TPA: XrtA/PEP-CTERM system TPR-repeat protein PrsT, partial [Stellaceae bacterium]|nr:XrtA/PEP-CTERM system TPR-repeat protein PrsT [Stellaceae bacterium]